MALNELLSRPRVAVADQSEGTGRRVISNRNRRAAGPGLSAERTLMLSAPPDATADH